MSKIKTKDSQRECSHTYLGLPPPKTQDRRQVFEVLLYKVENETESWGLVEENISFTLLTHYNRPPYQGLKSVAKVTQEAQAG